MDLKVFCNKCEDFDGSAEQFHNIFKEGVQLLNLDMTALAKSFSCNKTTADRWIAGKASPAKGYRFFVVKRMQHIGMAQEVFPD